MKIQGLVSALLIVLCIACTKTKNKPGPGEPTPDTTRTTTGIEIRKYLLTDSSFFMYSDATGFFFIDSGTVPVHDTIILALQLTDTPRYLIFQGDTVEETSDYLNTVFHYSPSITSSHLAHSLLYPDTNSFTVKHLYYYGGHTKSTVTLKGIRIY